tara:strand:- start:774 stop:1442 length:669 start_codon:yes stop_codon:yes gene_type:complete
MNVQLYNEFEMSSVNFSKMRKNKNGGKAVYINTVSGAGKILVELPYLRAPFGLSSFTDEATKRTSYSLDLSFDAENEDLQKTFEEFDAKVLEAVVANSTEWLGKKYNLTVMKEALYKPVVRPSKGDYPSTMKLKIMNDMKSGKFIPEAYNHMRERVDLDTIEKGQRLKAIIDINQIWFIDNKFGVSVRLQQVLLEPSKKLPSFAFRDVDNHEEDDAEEEYDE